MAEFSEKRYLDFAGLAEYDELLKAYLAKNSSEDVAALREEFTNAIIVEAGFREAADDALEELISKNAGAIEILNGDEDVEGSVKQQLNTALTDLIGGAPEILDTLKEIADWIKDDESGTQSLVSTVREVEKEVEDLREYVDTQDRKVYDAIQRIESDDIAFLFLTAVEVAEGQTVSEAIAALGEGEKLVLSEPVMEPVTIENDCVIDASGNIFADQVVIKNGADVKFINAKFSKPVIVE